MNLFKFVYSKYFLHPAIIAYVKRYYKVHFVVQAAKTFNSVIFEIYVPCIHGNIRSFNKNRSISWRIKSMLELRYRRWMSYVIPIISKKFRKTNSAH